MASDHGPVCREHLEFMQWADNMMLSTLTHLPQSQLTHDHGNSFKSLFDTLNHIYLGELIWLRKVTADPNVMMDQLPVPADLSALSTAWPDVHREWLEWAHPRSADDWTQPLAFKSRHFGEVSMPYWQIVHHVVNHGSYHRGQLATMLRQSAVTPPATDLLLFYKSRL
jgi:uncharacterized damage-inducible protein DinB